MKPRAPSTLLFNLTLDGTFEFLLDDTVSWRNNETPNRGFTDDVTGDKESMKTGKQKAAILKLLLGTIAGYAPVISRLYITQEALSLNDIWHRLRIFYGFRKSGALILDLHTYQLEEGESPEGLWERLYAFVMDNLLQPADALLHLGQQNLRETMSPTLLNTTVVLWLRAIHPSLPQLIKQKYSTELRNQTLSSIREDISVSLGPLLAEIHGESPAQIARAASYNKRNRLSNNSNKIQQSRKTNKFCALCESNNRSFNHYLSECPFLPEADRNYMTNIRTRIREIDIEDPEEGEIRQIPIDRKPPSSSNEIPQIRKVTVKNSPYLFVKYENHPVKLILDSGATANIIRLDFAKQIGATIYNTNSRATQADGVTNLDIAGEVHLVFKIDDLELYFDGLVTKDLSDNVLAGVPFMTSNDVYARPSQRKVYFGDRSFRCDITNVSQKANIIHIPEYTTVLPGDSIAIPVPEPLTKETLISIEPRLDAPQWFPMLF